MSFTALRIGVKGHRWVSEHPGDKWVSGPAAQFKVHIKVDPERRVSSVDKASIHGCLGPPLGAEGPSGALRGAPVTAPVSEMDEGQLDLGQPSRPRARTPRKLTLLT